MCVNISPVKVIDVSCTLYMSSYHLYSLTSRISIYLSINLSPIYTLTHISYIYIYLISIYFPNTHRHLYFISISIYLSIYLSICAYPFLDNVISGRHDLTVYIAIYLSYYIYCHLSIYLTIYILPDLHNIYVLIMQ